MTCQLVALTIVALTIAAHDPLGLARFWAGLLGGEPTDDRGDGIFLLPTCDTGFGLRFVATDEPKSGPNQMHLDLTSTSQEDQQQTVATALRLGARHLDVGQLPEEGHVVLADPEGNELCVVGPGNAFLAGCGFVGALACDGSREVGLFWSAALDWPLVWDQDEETAIQSPRGGPKITWGGPPLAPRTGTNRLQFELAVGDPAAEVDRLVSLGATLVGGTRDRVAMADPEGNDFSLRRVTEGRGEST